MSNGHTCPDMTEPEYRTYPAVNKSTLCLMRKSPLHYKWAMEHPTEDTAALFFGRALHMRVLEPEQFEKHYRIAPNVDRRTKAGRDEYNGFVASLHEGQELISAEDMDILVSMSRQINSNPFAFNLLNAAHTELPILWTDDATGMECKCKLDALKWNASGSTLIADVTDLKSCADASTDAFMRDALRYGYDVQAAHYIRGVKSIVDTDDVQINWRFIAVEKKPPCAVNVIEVGPDFIDRGTMILIDLMDKLKKCRETDEWPDYGKSKLILPEWAAIPDFDDE